MPTVSTATDASQDAASGGSKDRILAAALELFTEHGYRATSMRQIAERVGLTKATLYHHFSSKAEIIQSLLGPLLDSLDHVLDEAEGTEGLDAARERFLLGCVDTMIAQRTVLILLLSDVSAYADDVEVAPRVLSWMERATALLAGERPDWSRRIRAAQALAAMADPMILSTPAPDGVLRDELLRGARLLLDVSS